MSPERAKCTLHAKRPSQKMDTRRKNQHQSFGGNVGIALRSPRTACFCWRLTQQAQSSANFALSTPHSLTSRSLNPQLPTPQLKTPNLSTPNLCAR